jgi:hypothetical protein
MMPLNECARLHWKVRLIALAQRDAKGGGALVLTRTYGVRALERTIGALEPWVSVMNFKITRWDPSN